MGKQFIDVELTITSTVVYRLPRPTKAEVVEYMGDSESWDKDDPEGSIRDYIESIGIDDFIQGHRPVNVVVDDKEINDVYPADKGARPLEARPMVKLRCNLKDADGGLVEAWWHWDTLRRVGSEFLGETATSEFLAQRASSVPRSDGKRLKLMLTERLGERIQDIELVPVQSN